MNKSIVEGLLIEGQVDEISRG